MKNLSFILGVILLLALGSNLPCRGSNPAQGCANNIKNLAGGPQVGQDPEGDPFVVYSGNEYRHISDLKIWGGVGEHQLTWGRWANSRFVNGPQYFGTGHSWRHDYQWEMADAGTSGSGAAQVEIIYPEGYDNTFVQNSSNPSVWNAPASIEETLFESGNDFYLQCKNGFIYHFQRQFDGTGADYYLMTDFTDQAKNDYTLTYNAAHEVTQVSEPGGRYLQINYSTVNLSKTDFTTFASITSTPASAQYTEIAVTDPHAYRYLRFLGSDDSYSDVAEVEFYDTHGNKLTGTPFGASPASGTGRDFTQAFDGDTSTYYEYSQASGGYCGIDLGAGNATVIGKVRFYPRLGYEAQMADYWVWYGSSAGQFQGSNQAPVTQPVISSVTTSDGRTVTYNYTAFADPVLPSNYEVLSGATYDDGTQASYTYAQVLPSTRPLIASFVDPRYDLPFKKAATGYFSELQSPLGQIQKQMNHDTGEVLYQLGNSSSWTAPMVTKPGTGAARTYYQNDTTGQNMYRTDALGRSVYKGYDPNGFQIVEGDARGNFTVAYKSNFDNPTYATLADGSYLEWTRDSLDLPTSYTDELGHSTIYNRDANHRITTLTWPDSSTENFTYNGFGQPLTHQLRNGGTVSAIYDTTGLKTSSTDPLGNVTHYTYDTAGRLASMTDANGHVTSYQYNARGQITLITYADGSTHGYTYDTFGNKLTDTDELGHTTTYTYDTFNRCTSITDPLGHETQYVFRSNYYLTKPDEVILPSGKVIRNTYDLEDNLLSQTVGYGTVDAATTSYVYDGNNNVTSMTDPNGHVWSFAYDARNRKISQTDPLGHTTSYTYDGEGNVLTVTRPDGGVTTNVYDTMHHLIQTTDPKGEVTTMTYDLAGNLHTTTDARGNTYTYTYDLLNRRTSLTYPDGSAESYGYDAVGNMVTYVTREGQTKTSVFDNRNREVSYTWSDGETPGVTRTYDAAGRLLSSANGTSTCSYAYDNANRLLSESQALAGLSTPLVVAYGYDADGNRTSLTYPSGVAVTYGYTNRNKVSSISVGGTSLATYAYDGNSNIVSKNLSDGTLASYTYDAANRLTTLNHTLSGASFARFDYGYDSVNRRTYEKRDSAAGDVFGYDAVDQVTGVNYDATNPTSGSSGADRTVGYTYDATGNRTAVNDTVNGNASYTANSLNQYSNVGGNSYVYDGNGNLFIGNGFYFYDAQNRLIYGQEGSNIDEFGYDSKNRVAIRVVNGTLIYFIYDGWDLIEERNSSGTVLATYVHGVRQDEMLTRTTSSGTVYYHHNALGSVTDLTNASGVVVEKYKYDAFGKPAITDGSGDPLTASAYGNRFLFTGREYLAEVNLYDYRNRMYSADLGRFLQTDPERFSAGDVNIYRYCGNDPLNLIDPMGESFWGTVGNALAGAWAGASSGALAGGTVGLIAGGGVFSAETGAAGVLAGAIGGAIAGAVGGIISGETESNGDFNFSASAGTGLIAGTASGLTGGVGANYGISAATLTAGTLGAAQAGYATDGNLDAIAFGGVLGMATGFGAEFGNYAAENELLTALESGLLSGDSEALDRLFDGALEESACPKSR